MKILSINTTQKGGAAVVAKRLNEQFENEGVDIKTVTLDETGFDKFIKVLSVAEQIIWPMLMKTKNNIYHSPAIFSRGIESEVKLFNPNIVHLHWINGGLMKPEDLLTIKIPIVWTMHDMWPFCGAEHHTEDNRFIDGYSRKSRPDDENGIDINRFVWRRKINVYNNLNNIVFVCPSLWLYNLATKSFLLRNKKVQYIPNGVDPTVFFPVNKDMARTTLGLPKNKKVLLLGSAFISGDKNKQNDAFLRILEYIKDLKNDFIVVSLGSGDVSNFNKVFEEIGVQVKHFGFIEDEKILRDVYNASDLFLMFSRHENMPTMLIESMACGTPAIAFSIGGISEIIESDKWGYLVKPFDYIEYGNKLRKFILSENKFDKNAIVKNTLEKYNIGKTKKMYIDVFNSLIKRN